jgi:plasmid stabilization system protein ParE
MAYRVEVSRRAEHDIEETFEYIRSRAPLNAVRWREGLQRRLRTLQTNPEGLGFAPENDAAKADVRQLLYGRYRILYTVREKTVFIITFRHGARLFLTGEEIDAID